MRQMFALTTPDDLIRTLAQAAPAGVVPHFSSFGGVPATSRWASAVADGRIALDAGGGFRVEAPSWPPLVGSGCVLLAQPGVRVPLTAISQLWHEAVEIGRHIIWLHTFGERFADECRGRPLNRLPGRPDVQEPIPGRPEQLPGKMEYRALDDCLVLGWDQFGRIGPVTPGAAEYEISGHGASSHTGSIIVNAIHQVDGAGSDLDIENLRMWTNRMTEELRDLVAVLEGCVSLEQRQADLLDRIVRGPIISGAELTEAGRFPHQTPSDDFRFPMMVSPCSEVRLTPWACSVSHRPRGRGCNVWCLVHGIRRSRSFLPSCRSTRCRSPPQSRAAIAITGLTAYTTGFEIFMARRIRPGVPGLDEDPTPEMLSRGRPDPLAAPFFSLLLSDGTEVASGRPRGESEPTGPILQSRGGGGSTHSQFFRWWAWPLPPPGPLEFICQWPMYEISRNTGPHRRATDP